MKNVYVIGFVAAIVSLVFAISLLAQETKEGEGYYACPMGDHVSDKPGKCPNCGMELVYQEKAVYKCPMCDQEFNKPGKCPKCGMELEKAEETEKSDEAEHHHY